MGRIYLLSALLAKHAQDIKASGMAPHFSAAGLKLSEVAS